MSKISQIQNQHQIQSQKQILSHLQIQALKFLEMDNQTLSDEIYKAVSENPALEIVENKRSSKKEDLDFRLSRQNSSDNYQNALENTENYGESLQEHLLHQLNSINLSEDEYELSEKLIYNLDKNGFYGSSISPASLINKKKPKQNLQMLEECMQRIQKMDPVGTCVKNAEESLYVQACNSEEQNLLANFILDGRLEFLNPPEPAKILYKLNEYKKNWHKKTFATEIFLDKIKLDEKIVANALKFILSLNPHPAQGYIFDTNAINDKPDVVLYVEKKQGGLAVNNYEKGLVCGDKNFHFQIKYASGSLPELTLSKDFSLDKENYQKAQELINNLEFRKSTIVLQGCSIVNFQKKFFLKGPEYLSVLTRRQIAKELGIHESTVSRMAAKDSSKYIQTEWGLFPASYFFLSGVSSASGKEKISSETIKIQIQKIIKEYKDVQLSDSKLTELLNEKGIKIARRTVAKYRNQAGIKNSYDRK